jgi:hypothetical protein
MSQKLPSQPDNFDKHRPGRLQLDFEKTMVCFLITATATSIPMERPREADNAIDKSNPIRRMNRLEIIP